MLVVSQLYKTYGRAEILHGISLNVEEGEFVSLLGPSGCGKTTTLRCVAGLERPDQKSGEIKFGNQTLSSAKHFLRPEKRNFGMVFQSYAVWPHMNVADNVSFPLRIAKKSDGEIKERLKDILDLVDLSGLEKRFGHELSGGQQQRVALARALIMSPRLLLLDEPLSNLDALLREDLRVEIQRIQKKLKLTTIMVTHDQREALALSDRIIVMKNGHIEAQGTPEDLYKNASSDFVKEFLLGGHYVGKTSAEKILLFPRRWRISEKGASFKIISRLYLGHEYEYWASNSEWIDPVKFYSDLRLDITHPVSLIYS